MGIYRYACTLRHAHVSTCPGLCARTRFMDRCVQKINTGFYLFISMSMSKNSSFLAWCLLRSRFSGIKFYSWPLPWHVSPVSLTSIIIIIPKGRGTLMMNTHPKCAEPPWRMPSPHQSFLSKSLVFSNLLRASSSIRKVCLAGPRYLLIFPDGLAAGCFGRSASCRMYFALLLMELMPWL